MTELTLVEKIRQRVRFKASTLDSEIQDLIDETKADLELAGVDPLKIIDTDPLILRAVSTYCRAYYETDNNKAERLDRSYESIKQHLSMSVDYAVVVVVEEV